MALDDPKNQNEQNEHLTNCRSQFSITLVKKCILYTVWFKKKKKKKKEKNVKNQWMHWNNCLNFTY